MAGKEKPAFAAVPLRALVDDRVLPAHLRVLAVIAAHDHMSLPRGKGAGCYVSNQRLSGLTRLNYSVVARIQNELDEWGYLNRERREDDRRQKTSRVVYNDDDRTAFSRILECAGAEIVCPEANDMPEIVCPEATNGAEIVCLTDDKTAVNSTTSASEYIPLKGGIDSVKQGNKFSETARPLSAIARAVEKLRSASVDNYEEVTTFLSIVERELKRDPTQLTDAIADVLEHVTDQSLDTRLTSHAQRLLDTYDVYESEEGGFPDDHQDEPARADVSALPSRQVDGPETALLRAEAALAGYCEAGFPVGLIGKHLALIEREMARDPRPASAALIESLKRIVIHVADKAVQQHAGRLLGDYGHHAELNAADPEGLCPF